MFPEEFENLWKYARIDSLLFRLYFSPSSSVGKFSGARRNRGVGFFLGNFHGIEIRRNLPLIMARITEPVC